MTIIEMILSLSFAIVSVVWYKRFHLANTSGILLVIVVFNNLQIQLNKITWMIINVALVLGLGIVFTKDWMDTVEMWSKKER